MKKYTKFRLKTRRELKVLIDDVVGLPKNERKWLINDLIEYITSLIEK